MFLFFTTKAVIKSSEEALKDIHSEMMNHDYIHNNLYMSSVEKHVTMMKEALEKSKKTKGYFYKFLKDLNKEFENLTNKTDVELIEKRKKLPSVVNSILDEITEFKNNELNIIQRLLWCV